MGRGRVTGRTCRHLRHRALFVALLCQLRTILSMLSQRLHSAGLAAAKAAQISCNALISGDVKSVGWARELNTRTASDSLVPERIQWVFLGPPGVGKGTYSTRVAVALGVAHIAAGDLVRGEIKSGSPTGQKVRLASCCGLCAVQPLCS